MIDNPKVARELDTNQANVGQWSERVHKPLKIQDEVCIQLKPDGTDLLISKPAKGAGSLVESVNLHPIGARLVIGTIIGIAQR